MTKYGAAILEIITSSSDHLTAEEIYLRLKQDYPKVVQATVYNNLNQLYDQGMIRKVSAEGLPDRYDKPAKHDHLICKNCGRLSDIRLQDLTKMLQAQVNVDILSYDLKINYICPACQKARQNTHNNP